MRSAVTKSVKGRITVNLAKNREKDHVKKHAKNQEKRRNKIKNKKQLIKNHVKQNVQIMRAYNMLKMGKILLLQLKTARSNFCDRSNFCLLQL